MFSFKKSKNTKSKTDNSAEIANMVFQTIQEGVVIVGKDGLIEAMNPAAEIMLNTRSTDAAGLVWDSVLKVESKEGRDFTDTENPLKKAMNCNEGQKESMALILKLDNIGRKLPVAITVLPVRGNGKILTLRNIEKELEEEGEQAEFISTASHEMRTPVASIEGYLGLALNPTTATIDDRARKYLETAHKASVHLGELFKDLLDVTKLDDHKVMPRFEPVDLGATVKQMCEVYLERIAEAKLKFQYGAEDPKKGGGFIGFGAKKLEQVIYGYVDISFLREIMGNLIENAIKYTPEGGSIYVNVLGDGDRALINVTDTGIGIAAEDLQHIFQKFYRADNSQTRTEGGTGLGLYLVKQRTEAMGGRVWAESAFGEGSTFYVSLPRLTNEEYTRRLTEYKNKQAVDAFNNLEVKQNVEQNSKLVQAMNQNSMNQEMAREAVYTTQDSPLQTSRLQGGWQHESGPASQSSEANLELQSASQPSKPSPDSVQAGQSSGANPESSEQVQDSPLQASRLQGSWQRESGLASQSSEATSMAQDSPLQTSRLRGDWQHESGPASQSSEANLEPRPASQTQEVVLEPTTQPTAQLAQNGNVNQNSNLEGGQNE